MFPAESPGFTTKFAAIPNYGQTTTNTLVPLQATFALLIVSALVTISGSRLSWALRFRQLM